MQTDRGLLSSKVRYLNDNFRLAGQFMITVGISALSDSLKMQIVQKVRLFTDFTEGNDPHGEHDFGSFDIDGQTVNWKIDYYDPSMQSGSDKPWRADQTRRVLTVMLAEER
jgi:Protein of unknown function (DUF3768)